MKNPIEFTFSILEALVTLFVFLVGLAILAVVVMYVIDRTQTSHAVRRNFPVVGRFRYLFENMGEFFRRYSSTVRTRRLVETPLRHCP